MKKLYVFTAVLALASALPQIKTTNCVASCNCKEILPNMLDVVSCDVPLTINSTLFGHLDRKIITVIRFANVIIQEIKEDAFKKFSILEDVVIEKAHIGSVDSKAFDNIKTVKFADCGFDDTPNLYSQRLEELHFGNCRLDVIPSLDNLFSLTFLNLSGNYLSDVDITSFAELFDLETLILSNNQITKLPANIFVNNEELNSLYMDNNPLKYFYLNTSNKLETLSLKNCYLSSFDDRSTQRLYSLCELNLSNNKIRNLKARDFAHMNQLAVLDLSNNSLIKLDDDIFTGNPKLQKLTLDGNRFESLPKFTLPQDNQFEIYTFSCKNCGLKSLNKDSFKSMPAIVSLNLAYNNFTNIIDMFDSITSLRMLDISHNNISSLSSGAFNHNRNLETLNLAGNPLMALNPEAFMNTKAIKKIDASNCRLYKLWTSNTTKISSLKKLLVANNQLTTLSFEDFKIISGLEAIDLHNNPLKLDDEFCKVISYLESRSVYPIEYSDPTTNPEDILAFDIDNFIFNNWSNIHKKKCPEMTNVINENEDIASEDLEDTRDDLNTLKKLSASNDDDDYYDDTYEDDDDNDETENEDEDDKVTAEIVEDENMNLARASYILSITSVFVLTALAVLILAVTATLCILKRNNSFNMHRANLPRLKIPLWETQLGQKKHSGSVYRPLSEDLSGPKTPKCSRYEFSATPTVHTSQ